MKVTLKLNSNNPRSSGLILKCISSKEATKKSPLEFVTFRLHSIFWFILVSDSHQLRQEKFHLHFSAFCVSEWENLHKPKGLAPNSAPQVSYSDDFNFYTQLNHFTWFRFCALRVVHENLLDFIHFSPLPLSEFAFQYWIRSVPFLPAHCQQKL